MTSKIASLWKRVEESKAKADSDKAKDRKITKGKVQATDNTPASSGAQLVRSGTYDKINEMADTVNMGQMADSNVRAAVSTSQSQTELKPRSRSRLSIKLSKFSLKKKSSMDDQTNGNAALSPTDSDIVIVSPTSDELGNSIQIVSPSDSEHQLSPQEEVDTIKMHPQFKQPNHTGFKPSSSNRSPASAIVAPFNYNPNQAAATNLKRNTSYVSSLGRKREVGDGGSEESVVTHGGDDHEGSKQSNNASMTNSAMVTLV